MSQPDDEGRRQGEPCDQPAQEPQEPQVVELVDPRVEADLVVGCRWVKHSLGELGAVAEPVDVLPLLAADPDIGSTARHEHVGDGWAAHPDGDFKRR